MATRLGALDVLVVDCQSTGSTPDHGHLIELGFRRFTCDAPPPPIAAHVVALPAGAQVPRMVSRLTGLTDRDVQDGLPRQAAWNLLNRTATDIRRAERAAHTPTVIHFAQFEDRFLRDLHETYEAPFPFPFDIVCTHKIAKRLLPDLPRLGLRALAGYFGYTATQLRRSEDHVDATCFVWQHLVEELELREDVCTWEELAAWMSTRRGKRGRRQYPMPKEKRLGLPDEPGVYRFLRTNGDLLYVGKAKSLKKRVNSHFTQKKNATDRSLEMLTQARDLSFTQTATALEAALLESDEIKKNEPPYNVALLEERRAVWFVARDLCSWSREPDVEHPIGPLPSKRAIVGLGTIHRLMTEPTITDLLPYTIASALGITSAFAPEAECFRDGFDIFCTRHFGAAVAATQARLLAVARRLAVHLQTNPRPTRDEDVVQWDAARVVEHLEQTAARAPQLIARARWLTHLTDSSVSFTPRVRSRHRRLIIEGGHVTRADWVESGLVGSGRSIASHNDRPRMFDIAMYDRLRVLVTELRRVLRDGGAVEVCFNDRVVFSGPPLVSALGRL